MWTNDKYTFKSHSSRADALNTILENSWNYFSKSECEDIISKFEMFNILRTDPALLWERRIRSHHNSSCDLVSDQTLRGSPPNPELFFPVIYFIHFVRVNVNRMKRIDCQTKLGCKTSLVQCPRIHQCKKIQLTYNLIQHLLNIY